MIAVHLQYFLSKEVLIAGVNYLWLSDVRSFVMWRLVFVDLELFFVFGGFGNNSVYLVER